MRYEVMRLMQFVFSLSLILVAFGAGMFVGWRRWGRRGHPEDLSGDLAAARLDGPDEAPGAFAGTARRDLFAPEIDLSDDHAEVDLRVGAGPRHLGLPAGASASHATHAAPEALA